MFYLMRIGRIYHYRRRIPTEFVAAVGLTEIRQSLKTPNLDHAKALASKVNAEVEMAFFSARMGIPPIEAFRGILCAKSDATRNTAPGASVAPGPSASERLCSTLFERFRVEMVRMGKWGNKTEFENGTCFRRFLKMSGDPPVETVTHSHLQTFRDDLCRLSLVLDAKRDNGKPVEPRGLSHARINSHLTVLSSFFKWLFQHEFIDRNPALHLLLPKRKVRPDLVRQRYTPSEIRLKPSFRSTGKS